MNTNYHKHAAYGLAAIRNTYYHFKSTVICDVLAA